MLVITLTIFPAIGGLPKLLPVPWPMPLRIWAISCFVSLIGLLVGSLGYVGFLGIRYLGSSIKPT